MQRDRIRQLVNVLALLVTLVVNGLANALPLNGVSTAEISDRFKVFFVPAGYVFAIWGLIYAALLSFAVYQALPGQRENPRLRRIGYLFAASCLANCLWIFLWHYQVFVLTIVVMAVLLGLLLAIYLRLGIGQVQVRPAEKWLVNVPFSIYLGWISVATIANAADVLDYVKWNGWGIAPEAWAVLMLIVGLILAAVMGLRRRDIAYQLVILWAFIGIAVKQAGTPLVALAAWVMATLVGVSVIASAVVTRGRAEPLAVTPP